MLKVDADRSKRLSQSVHAFLQNEARETVSARRDVTTIGEEGIIELYTVAYIRLRSLACAGKMTNMT